MKRFVWMFVLLFGPALVLSAIGCHREVRTVETKESVHQSEPRMVSPGHEVLE